MPSRVRWLWLLVVTLLAVALRCWQLGQAPVSLYWDEAAIYLDAKLVASNGLDMHGRPWYQVMYPSYGDYKLPVYIWLSSAVFKLFGASEWGLRLPSAMAGVGMGLLGGWLARRLWLTSWAKDDSKLKSDGHAFFVQISAMLILALSPWSLMFSRTGFEGHVGQFLLVVSMLLLTFQRKSFTCGILSALVGGLATYTYFSVRFVWPVTFVLVWWLTNPPSRPKWIKHGLLTLILPIFLFGLTLLPMTNSPLYADSNRFRLSTDSVFNNEYALTTNIYREKAGNTPLDRVLFNKWTLTGIELFKNYSDNLSPSFLFLVGDTNLRHGTGQFGLFIFAMMPLFVYGWIRLAEKNKVLGVVLLVWWLTALLPASVPENTPHALRSLNALFPLTMVFAVGLASVIEMVLSLKFFTLKKESLVVGSVIGLMVVLHAPFLYHYFVHYPTESAVHWHYQYKEVAQAVFKMRKADQQVNVFSIDDRWYLWVLAYGPYTAETIQSWPTTNFKFLTFDDFKFVPPDASVRSSILVGRSDQITEWLSKNQVAIEEDLLFPGHKPEYEYRVVSVKAQ